MFKIREIYFSSHLENLFHVRSKYCGGAQIINRLADFYSEMSRVLNPGETRPPRQCLLGCFLIVHRNTRIRGWNAIIIQPRPSSPPPENRLLETSLKARDADLLLLSPSPFPQLRPPFYPSSSGPRDARAMNRKTVSADRNSAVTSLSIKRLLYPLKLLTTRRT